MKNSGLEKFKNQINRYLNQLEYVKNISTEAPFFPQHVHIEPTNACNLRCIHCVQENITRKRGYMDWEVYIKIIDEIAPLGCALTLDVQGEPLLHPKIVEMVKYAKKNGCHVSVLTNGTNMTEKKAYDLIMSEVDRVVFSFDAIEKKLYEEIRINANFEKTFNNILNFIKLNYENGQKTFICMSIILEKKTEMHIDEYKQYFNSLPIDTIFVSELLNMAGGSSVSNEIDLKDNFKLPKSQWPICRIGWEDLTVNWDGSVCPCPLDYNVTYAIGNIKETSLQEMWSNENYKNFRKAHLDKNYSAVDKNGTLCSNCSCLWDPEYDIRKYKEFIEKAIIRQAKVYANSLVTAESKDSDKDMKIKYKKVIDEINKIKNSNL